MLSQAEKERLVDNMGSHLANAQKFIQVLNFIFNILKDFSGVLIYLVNFKIWETCNF